MKLKTLLLTSALFSTSAFSNGLHLSPEVKIGAYHGFGIQAGITDVANSGALYLSYSHLWYDSSRYDETVDAYRIGIQNMFGRNQIHGFQAEIGMASYDGAKTRSSEIEEKTAHGLSLGGAYVYQATPVLGLRAGFDMNIFDHNKTFVPYDTTINLNLGAIVRF
ncbi:MULTISPECIES: hypothetical protein [Vibrio]|uniref:Outer membrane protein beta-barrel domain-containing protein n=2 Tax=Vibrio cyclitrophicus TaxID=47951 RepID=A0A7Z1MKC7_9VIBR|nr:MULTISPECIES: hypothetical protein [Vibrio]MBE8607153.1 hypothetical protein [Vibrio sp. OPT10]MBU2931307.1 hypothetical protein [Vibrio cyclitrophicus]NOH21520.1 hypothetical protein [Vibrio cyclitrophicus]NOI34571.1 hypothetical protein [Vibrio cyclitrophicus]OBT05200.1 hypothetical protein A9257_05555 [Vibrio cyclitrophicus]|tara:strand:+ start:187 stop:678 length:492 start_codon:yes stop_codon:yes gene_type:complete